MWSSFLNSLGLFQCFKWPTLKVQLLRHILVFFLSLQFDNWISQFPACFTSYTVKTQGNLMLVKAG